MSNKNTKTLKSIVALTPQERELKKNVGKFDMLAKRIEDNRNDLASPLEESKFDEVTEKLLSEGLDQAFGQVVNHAMEPKMANDGTLNPEDYETCDEEDLESLGLKDSKTDEEVESEDAKSEDAEGEEDDYVTKKELKEVIDDVFDRLYNNAKSDAVRDAELTGDDKFEDMANKALLAKIVGNGPMVKESKLEIEGVDLEQLERDIAMGMSVKEAMDVQDLPEDKQQEVLAVYKDKVEDNEEREEMLEGLYNTDLMKTFINAHNDIVKDIQKEEPIETSEITEFLNKKLSGEAITFDNEKEEMLEGLYNTDLMKTFINAHNDLVEDIQKEEPIETSEITDFLNKKLEANEPKEEEPKEEPKEEEPKKEEPKSQSSGSGDYQAGDTINLKSGETGKVVKKQGMFTVVNVNGEERTLPKNAIEDNEDFSYGEYVAMIFDEMYDGDPTQFEKFISDMVSTLGMLKEDDLENDPISKILKDLTTNGKSFEDAVMTLQHGLKELEYANLGKKESKEDAEECVNESTKDSLASIYLESCKGNNVGLVDNNEGIVDYNFENDDAVEGATITEDNLKTTAQDNKSITEAYGLVSDPGCIDNYKPLNG